MLTLDNLKVTPKPDFSRLEKVLRRSAIPDRVPLFECYPDVAAKVMAEKIKRSDCTDNFDWEWKRKVGYQYRLGYDHANGRCLFKFPVPGGHVGVTEEGNSRDFKQAGDYLISNEEEFEKYAWPEVKDSDFVPIERITKLLPEGMKILALSPGVFEHVLWIMGYERACFAFIENPVLIKRVFDGVGERILKSIKTMASMDGVGAVLMGDDLGFKTQTMVSPDLMREYVFPWHKKITEAVHYYGKTASLHACGNVKEVFQDLIDAGWDGKHSYEDNVFPLWEAKEKYGNKISYLGGFDMNKLTTFTPEEIRKHTRFMIDKCAPGGGFAIGSGNSIADFVPFENLLTMIEETFSYGKYK